MPRTTFDDLPPHARLWIFAASRPLEASERTAVLGEVDAFLDQWAAHGVPLTSARELRYDRFLFIGVDEAAAGVSGCSIDALVRRMKDVERALGLTLADHGPVLFRDAGGIQRLGRDDFAELARRGTVSPDTTVFNNALTRVGDLVAGKWEVPARESWHQAAFFD